MDMRKIFLETLAELAQRNPNVVFLTGDLGYTVVEPFAEKHPERFFNVGVAEQNMVGIATGLAEAGFIPFVYSIVNFAVLRPYEFIRNGPILHQFPVRIVGVGGGFEYGTAGMTHYGLEDVGILRIQKGITVIVPSDQAQIKTILKKTLGLPQPIYYRVAKGDKTSIPELGGRFDLGRAQVLKEGGKVVVFALGTMVREALKAEEQLKQKGVKITVVAVNCFNPSPDEDVKRILKDKPLAITVEDHYAVGGLGSYVSEVVAQNKLNCRVETLGVKEIYDGKSGSRDFMLNKYGINASKIVETVLNQSKS